MVVDMNIQHLLNLDKKITTGSISFREISSLNHEILDDSEIKKNRLAYLYIQDILA